MASVRILDVTVVDGKKYYGPAATLQNDLNYSHYEDTGFEYGGDTVSDTLFSKASLASMLKNNQVEYVESKAVSAAVPTTKVV
jgi:hypothetical protein